MDFQATRKMQGHVFGPPSRTPSVTVALKQAGITAGSESSSNSVAVWSKRALCPQVQPDTGMIRSVHSE